MKLKDKFENRKKKFICECCGIEYDKIPLCFGSDYPDFYFSIPPEERDKRIEMKKSLCVIDERFFFHRGRLEIPINNNEGNLLFDVWLSISKENFEIRMDDWENPQRIDNQPYSGWLQTQIPTYQYSINIKAKAIEEKVGTIPKIVITDKEHQLTKDQENGITMKEANKIVQFILERQHNKETRI